LAQLALLKLDLEVTLAHSSPSLILLQYNIFVIKLKPIVWFKCKNFQV
jgi:hypothetical protein